MASIVTQGLNKIEIAAILTDGSTGTEWTSLGKTAEDSCILATAAPTDTEIFVEESDDPFVVISKAGKTTISWKLSDADATAMALVMGGTAVATVWTAAATLPNIEMSVKVTPLKGHIWTFPRVKLTAVYDATFNKKSIGTVDIVGTILTPNKSGLTSSTATPVA